ncbi:MAG: hypothetical protein QOE90_1980 [Thermoplasmata archaeon]|jgi:uncharacterized membrane protein|nr:hypothetical protein [Thermoplasmata archaeon]
MRTAILLAGMALMVLGAGAGLVVGHEVRACAATLQNAALRDDVGAYNAAVPQCNALVQQRSMAFGVVILGAIVAAAPVGYEAIKSRGSGRAE